MSILYVILAVLLFGLLVGVHEAGHFLAAKACGVRVDEFSLGMGPALWKKQKGETLYALRAVPFGGYCAMLGEDETVDDPRAFTSQPHGKRILILCAGAFMNFVLGFVIVLLLYSGAYAFRNAEIIDFMEGCPYQSEEGLHVGDRFYKKAFAMEPLLYAGQSQKMFGFYFGYDVATPAVTLRNAWDTTMEFGRWVRLGLLELIHGRVSMDEMAGPVGIVDMMAETGENAETAGDALYSIFYFTAFIAVNLAIMNMLPIPALDGGRIFLLLVTWLIESVTHKKLDPKYEGYIHAAGMVMLLGLMAFIMFHDLWRIFTR